MEKERKLTKKKRHIMADRNPDGFDFVSDM